MSLTFEEKWRKIEVSVDILFTDIFKNSNKILTYENYMLAVGDVYTCTQPLAGKIVDNSAQKMLYVKVRQYLEKHCSKIAEDISEFRGEELLQLFCKNWESYCFSTKIYSNFFNYLNRFYVARNLNIPEVYNIDQLAFVVWRDTLIEKLQVVLVDAALGLITLERNGSSFNTRLISGLVQCFIEVGLDEKNKKENNLKVYKEYFEKRFLENTREFYSVESLALLDTNSVTEYMKKINNRLNEESRRVISYLHSSTTTDLMTICKNVFIELHVEVFHVEFQVIIYQEQIEDLNRMYNLFLHIKDGVQSLCVLFEQYMIKFGLAAIDQILSSDLNDGKIYVETILIVISKFNKMVKDAFENDSKFIDAFDRAIKEFVNKNSLTIQAKSSSRSSELLVKYCDSILKKGSQVNDILDIENILNSIIVIFKYIEEKDVFQKFYTKLFAKRLVQSSSASDDSENSMINKLKALCGYEYTAKLQRMFQDIHLSKDFGKSFDERLKNSKTNLGMDFTMQILSSGSWPFQPPPSGFIIPEELMMSYNQFMIFYQGQHQGRRLQWLYSMCKGEINTTFTNQRYTVQASIFQIAILLQFNGATTHTLDNLAKNTGINEPGQLVGILETLTRCKLLLEDPIRKSYSLNLDFKFKKNRFNINLPIKKEEKIESDTTYRSIEDDRKIVIQACLVRVMKNKGKLNHNTLLTEAITQLSTLFKPTFPMMKKCIEMLIDKEYLARVEGERDEYIYIP